MRAYQILLVLALAVAATREVRAADAPSKNDAAAADLGRRGNSSLRLDLLNRERAITGSGSAFGTKSWVVVPPPPKPAPVVVEPPKAPPLPFRYMGQVDDGRGGRTFFLIRGTNTLSVTVGENIDGTYRLESADNGILQFTYLPLRERQSLQIGVGP